MSALVSPSLRATRSAAPDAKVREPRVLFPKEHGAYFQLAIPLVAALVMGRTTVSAVLFGVAAAAAFLGHESLLIVIGARGGAAVRKNGPRAARLLAIFGVLALVAGTAAWSAAFAVTGAVPCIPLALAAMMAVVIASHRERTAIGELVAGAALTSASLPVAFASGVPASHVWPVWMTWLLVTSAGTWAVRAVIGVKKGSTSVGSRVATVIVVALATSILAIRWPWAALAASPSVAIAVTLTALPPHPRALRRVGWSLAVATLLAAVILTVSVKRLAPSSSSSSATVQIEPSSNRTSNGSPQ